MMEIASMWTSLAKKQTILEAAAIHAPAKLNAEELRQGQLRLTASGAPPEQREFLRTAILAAERVFIETGYFKLATLGDR